MEVRTFSYYLTFSQMKRYLENRGYIVKTTKQILKDIGIDKEVYEKFNKNTTSAFRYSFAYLPEEREFFLHRFINNVNKKLEYGLEHNDYYGYDSKFGWSGLNNNCDEDDVYSNIVDIISRRLMKEDFEKYILDGERKNY